MKITTEKEYREARRRLNNIGYRSLAGEGTDDDTIEAEELLKAMEEFEKRGPDSTRKS